jgi:hypothetical protein
MGPIKPVSPYRMPVGSRESEWSCIYIYIYIRLKIKPNRVRIRF